MVLKTPIFKTHIKHEIELAIPRESNPNVSIPTTMPETPQVSYTVLDTDLATITPEFYNHRDLMHLYVATYQNSGVATTLNYSTKFNDEVWASGSNTNNDDNDLTLSFRHTPMEVGDTIEVYLWESTGSSTLTYYGLSITPSQITPAKDKTLFNLSMSDSSAVPIFSLSGRTNIGINRYNMKHVLPETVGITTPTLDFGSYESKSDDFICRQQYGDNYGGDWFQALNNTSDNIPYLYGNRIFKTIEYDVIT